MRLASPQNGDQGLALPSGLRRLLSALIAASVTISHPLSWWLPGLPASTVRHLFSSMTPWLVQGVRSPFAGIGMPRSSVSSLYKLVRLRGIGLTSGATQKLSPTGCPGVGKGPVPR